MAPGGMFAARLAAGMLPPWHESRAATDIYKRKRALARGGLSQTTCDAQRFARDPGRFLGGQEDGGRRNVLGLADTAEWDLRLKLFAKVAFRHAGRMEAFGFHHARADGIH